MAIQIREFLMRGVKESPKKLFANIIVHKSD